MLKITDKLTLIPLEMSHKNALAKYLNDPDIYKQTLRIPYPYKMEHAETWIEKVKKMDDINGIPHNWSISHHEEGVIGGIGLMLKEGLDAHKDEIGYWLAKPFRGQGIMTLVLQKFCDYLFEHRELSRIEAVVFADNKASGRALEKAGFELEGRMRKYFIKDGKYLNAILYAKIF